jgi:peptidoglycan/xylan/chitin deacetylase (PgdA/CDA1 family)
MYHVIGDPRPEAPYPELFVSEANFIGQMRWLREHGYAAVTLHDVWLHWQEGTALPDQPVVVTFDDGYRGIATRAAPALAAYHWAGVLDLDLSNVKRSEGFGEPSIRWLVAAGWEVDSHSLTHPDLTAVDDAQLEHELTGSRKAIRRLFGEPAEFFCYPAGRFDARVVAAVVAAGYLGATTTESGLADRRDPYRLARVRVDRSDGVAGFAMKLTQLDPR